MNPDEYQCACCKGIFRKAVSDEEAMKELRENFGDVSQQDCGVLCDECYKEFMKWFEANISKN